MKALISDVKYNASLYRALFSAHYPFLSGNNDNRHVFVAKRGRRKDAHFFFRHFVISMRNDEGEITKAERQRQKDAN